MSYSSSIDICNLALLRLGANPITSLSDNTTSSKACALAYNHTREALLRRHFWNFALARTALAADVDEPAFRFSYQYTLPSDFLRVKEIYQQGSPYTIEGTKLLTNDGAPLNLVYVKNITDVSKFDPLFVECLALIIAIKIGGRLQGDGFNPGGLAAELMKVLADAKLVGSQDVTPAQMDISTFNGAHAGNTGNFAAVGFSVLDY